MITDVPRSSKPNADGAPVQYAVLSHRLITWWAVLITTLGVGVATWLLFAYTGGDPDANRVKLDAIRTAGTVVVGSGGAVALLLAARRQRSTEIALKQKDRDQSDVRRAYALQERAALASEVDAVARRITDLYAMPLSSSARRKLLFGWVGSTRSSGSHKITSSNDRPLSTFCALIYACPTPCPATCQPMTQATR